MNSEIRRFILQGIPEHPRDISRRTAEHFKLNRRSVLDHLASLIHEGMIVAEGRTKSRQYKLSLLIDQTWDIPLGADADENEFWHSRMAAAFSGIDDNVRVICQTGLTEMLNNAIDHSEAPSAKVTLRMTAATIDMLVMDQGVGIFEKIRAAKGLTEPRHAILELSKGKFTTAPDKHSGIGIFFTSKMFDRFTVLSGDLSFFVESGDKPEWLIEDVDREHAIHGTTIEMRISRFSPRTSAEVYDRFTSMGEAFSRTHVPVKLARYGDDKLVSRSQAKMVLSRFEQFGEVMLDFSGVDTVGQAFADEIFRVFPLSHPEVRIVAVNTTPQIEQMIAWAKGARGVQGPLF